jgi:phosphomannomutase
MPTLILSVSGARGIVGDGLDEGVVRRLAAAFAQTVKPRTVVLGRDSRRSGPVLGHAAATALTALGCRVTDLGIVPTPTVQVAVEEQKADGGIVVTASHNPLPWNALKFVGADGTFLGAEAVTRLIAAFRAGTDASGAAPEAAPPSAPWSGSRTTLAGEVMLAVHVERILRTVDAGAIRRAALRVVVDAVRGAGGLLVGPLLARLGTGVEWIDGEPDGQLPRHPEPRAERLDPLLERVRRSSAALGFALDPDGDRCAVVTAERVLGEEWCLPLAAWSRLRGGDRGPLVANLSTSSHMEWVAERFGVPLHRTPVGEAHVVARMREVGAILGGEGNGGVIDPAVHLGRDAGVAIARLLALEVTGPGGRGGIAEAARVFPPRVLLKQALAIERERLEAWGAALRRIWGEPSDAQDGWRWSWPGAWAHVRPSGTEPIVRLFVEAATLEEARARVEAAEREAGAVRESDGGRA